MCCCNRLQHIIIGFNVRPERKAAELAQQEGIEIRLHSIIYELQMKSAWHDGLLDPTFKENYLGRAEVLNIFRIPKVGTIAGCRFQDGVIRRDVSEGHARRRTGLQGQDQLAQAVQGRCQGSDKRHGMRHRPARFSDLKEGDLIEAFSTEKLAADLGALTSPKRNSTVSLGRFAPHPGETNRLQVSVIEQFRAQRRMPRSRARSHGKLLTSSREAPSNVR